MVSLKKARRILNDPSGHSEAQVAEATRRVARFEREKAWREGVLGRVEYGQVDGQPAVRVAVGDGYLYDRTPHLLVRQMSGQRARKVLGVMQQWKE